MKKIKNKNLVTFNNNKNNGWKNDGFDNYNDEDFDYELKYLNRMKLHSI